MRSVIAIGLWEWRRTQVGPECAVVECAANGCFDPFHGLTIDVGGAEPPEPSRHGALAGRQQSMGIGGTHGGTKTSGDSE